MNDTDYIYYKLIEQGIDPNVEYVTVENISEDDQSIVYQVKEKGSLKKCVEYFCKYRDQKLDIIALKHFAESIDTIH